jgi:hypothetical protein
MRRRPHGIGLLLITTFCLPAFAQNASIRHIHVLNSRDAVEIEIEASDRMTPQTQVLTGPDRLVVDLPNATPGAELGSQSVNRGEVKSVRVGLFQSKPPITRVVLDLNSPPSYKIFPSGRTVLIRVTGPLQNAVAVDDFPPISNPVLVHASFPGSGLSARPVALETGPATKPSLDVTFHDGLLSIRANKASLSEVLYAVHQHTGAEVAVTAGAEQEQVVADVGPGPAPEVLAHLLNGSRFNFLILSSPENPAVLDRVILSPRGDGGITAVTPSSDNGEDDSPPLTAAAQVGSPQPLPVAGEMPAVREVPPRPQPGDSPPD